MEAKLKSQLNSLEVIIVENAEGGFGAVSNQEPLFFLTAATADEALARARNVIADYAATFHKERVSVTMEKVEEPIRVRSVGRFDAALAYA
jgi:hypothetical protein